MDDPSCHTVTLMEHEIQKVTKLSVVHVCLCTGTGSMSLLVQELFAAKVETSGSRLHVFGQANAGRQSMEDIWPRRVLRVA